MLTLVTERYPISNNTKLEKLAHVKLLKLEISTFGLLSILSILRFNFFQCDEYYGG